MENKGVSLAEIKAMNAKAEYLNNPEYKVNHSYVMDKSREASKDHMPQVIATIKKALKTLTGTFYISLISKRLPGIVDSIKYSYIASQDCPVPACKQIVYKFDSTTDDLEFLWATPDVRSCIALYANRYDLNIGKHGLMPYVVDLIEGNLLRKARKLNEKTERMIWTK